MGMDQLSPEAQEFAQRLIRRKSRQLAAKENFTPSDREDVSQDLWLHLYERLDKFDAEKGTIFAFIVTVVERKAISIMRRHSAAKRDICRCSSLNLSVRADDGTRIDLASTITQDAPNPRLCKESRHPQHCVEMALDVATVMEQLPSELRDIGERLKTHTLGTGRKLNDVGHESPSTFASTTPAADNAVAAIWTLAVGLVPADICVRQVRSGHCQARDPPLLQPQSHGVVVDFDLHVELRDFEN